MSFLDAAHAVLSQAAAPLHYKELTARAAAAGLLHTTGATPWETMNARLAVDIQKQGEASLFVRTAPGTFALRTWGLTPEPPPELAARVPHLPT